MLDPEEPEHQAQPGLSYMVRHGLLLKLTDRLTSGRASTGPPAIGEKSKIKRSESPYETRTERSSETRTPLSRAFRPLRVSLAIFALSDTLRRRLNSQ